MAVVHHADVAAAEDGSFVWVVCDGELGQVETEFLSHVEGEDETFHGFVGRPLFLCRAPCDRRVPSYDFPELCFNQSQGACLSIAFFVELLDGEVVFTCSEHEFEGTYFGFKESLDG